MTTRGGKRTGAGRKPGNRKSILYARVSEKTFNKIHKDAKTMKKSLSEYIEWYFGENVDDYINKYETV